MQKIKLIFDSLNYTGYICWSFSIYNFLGEIFTHTFNIQNVNSFFSCIATIVAVAFAIAKLIAYVRDSKIKSKILEEELKEKQNANFYNKWSNEFLKDREK